MSKINETETINELVDNINKKTVSKKFKVCEKFNQCKAAKKYSTIGTTYKSIEEGKEVYFIKEKSGKSEKISAYVRCSKTSNEDCDYCNIHFKMNSNNLKVFDKDIKPQSITDTDRWLATIKDPFFDNMRKKKENISDSISFILKNKKSKAYYLLSEYAKKLILDNLNNEKHIIEKKSSQKKSSNSTKSKSTKNNVHEDDNIEEEAHISINHHKEEHEDNEVHNDADDEANDEEIEEQDEDENENEEEIEEQDEDDFVKVVSNSGIVYYIKDNNEAYGENEDETFSNIGVLTEVKKKYHTIVHNDKYYTIFYSHTHPRKGTINLCVVSRKIYDKKMNHIGNGVKIGNGTNYDLKFSDEI